MIKDIRYKGYTANPSDYECEDGELAMSLNVIHEDGSLRPVLKPKVILQLGTGAKVIYVHENTAYTNYIILNESKQEIYWRNIDSNKGDLLKMNGYKGSVIAVGNTLVFSTDSGMHYFLWKDDAYIDLGTELPELNVEPYISTTIFNGDGLKRMFNYMVSENAVISEEVKGIGDDLHEILTPQDCDNLLKEHYDSIMFNDKLQQKIYEKLFSVMNPRSFLLKKHGYFFEPFYVRFAYRMFDGSHTRHTVPVIMVPNTWGKPLIDVKITSGINPSSGASTTTAEVDPIYSASKLFANIILSNNIDDWKDIITDVDVFVTEPLIDYTDNAKSLDSIRKIQDTAIPKIMTCKLEKDKIVSEWKKIFDSNSGDDTSEGYFVDFYNEIYFQYDKNKKFSRIPYNLTLPNLKDQYLAFDVSKYKVEAENITPIDISEFNIETELNLVVYSVNDILEKEERFKVITDNQSDFYVSSYVIKKNEIISYDIKFYMEITRSDDRSYDEILVEYNNFYKISELNISKLVDNRFNGEVPIKKNLLQSLVTQQMLADIGQNHNNMIVGDMFSYNSRLNVILEKEKITSPSTSLKTQNPARLLSFVNKVKRAYVEIYDNSQHAYVEMPVSGDNDFYLEYLLCFSYPHNNVKNLVLLIETPKDYIIRDEFIYNKLIIPLKRHSYLNLSYAFNSFEQLEGTFESLESESDFIIPTNDTIEYGNIIRLSDVNNPFRFSEEFTVSLPVKEIYALSTAAKALSQGQFGQYPLYAFTSDGIWALELTSTGTYSARQPISRDVVLNKESITQIDNSVLFATDRGIMLISGSQVVCISDKINTMDQFTLNELPKADKLMAMYNAAIDDINKMPSQNIPSIPGIISPTIPPAERSLPTGDKSDISLDDVILLPFNEFLANCRMIYDYAHQHIIVYNPEVRYAYVYSLKSQLWGMMYSQITHNVNSYPEALAMENSRLVDFSKTGNDKAATMTVTRPLDMGEPDAFKTISTIIQRGNMNDKMKQVLYGSNDLNNWFVVWSSDNKRMSGFSGSPWKYYRIAMIREFDKSESIYGFSVQYVPKLGNRLR